MFCIGVVLTVVAMSMGDEILLNFLEIGVINVGSDDTKLEKLRATAQELAGTLKKAPVKTAAFTMVAADPEVTATDPTVIEAVTVLKKHWVTMANTFQSTPVAIIRAVLLDAVVQVARNDELVASAFVNTARNILPYVDSGNEAPVWLGVLNELEEKVDHRAETEWATPDTISIENMDYKAPEALVIQKKNLVTNRDVLRDKIYHATGPVGGDHNPHWPQNNVGAWAQEFATRMSVAVAEAIDSVEKANALEPVNISAPLQSLAHALSSHLKDALAAFGGATSGLQRRTNLLWWKEALYSPSAHTSYRNMSAFTSAALMALDLFEQVPTFSPASVSAFLNEAILLLPAVAAAEKQSFLSLALEARQSQELLPLREAAAQLFTVPAGRSPLLSLIGHSLSENLDSVTLRTLAGVDDQTAITPAEWGTFLFREMQAARATVSTNGKRSQRKA